MSVNICHEQKFLLDDQSSNKDMKCIFGVHQIQTCLSVTALIGKETVCQANIFWQLQHFYWSDSGLISFYLTLSACKWL